VEVLIRNRLILAIIAGAILLAPVAAWAATDFLSIRQAIVKTSSNKVDGATLQTRSSIPKDGRDAFGYGVLTSGAIIVSTTHKGVLDSQAQGGDKNNPVFHNHYIQLIDDPKNCKSTPAVNLKTITFGILGKVSVGGSNIAISNLPKSFEDLTQSNTLVDPKVVSFRLDPKFDGDTLLAVCVTDIKPADKVFVT
jgi:hypothetical protein